MKVFLFFMCMLLLADANLDFDLRPTLDFDEDYDLDDYVTEVDDLGPPPDLDNEHELKNAPDQEGIDPEKSLDNDDEYGLNDGEDGDDDVDDDDIREGKAAADGELERLRPGGVSKSPASNINPPARHRFMKVGHFYFNADFFYQFIAICEMKTKPSLLSILV